MNDVKAILVDLTEIHYSWLAPLPHPTSSFKGFIHTRDQASFK